MYDFKVKLDGTQVSDPTNWKDFALKAGWEGKFFNTISEQEFTFVGDGYDYIESQYDSNGFCDSIDVEVWIDDTLEFEGKIFLSDIELDRIQRRVSANIADSSYDSLIKGRIDQEFVLDVDISYDGSTLTGGAASSRSIQFHTVSTGTYSGSNRTGYSVYEAFDFLVRAMTNGQMEFDSDFFGAGGDAEGMTLFQGQEIRSATGDAPKISFSDLFDDLDSLYNLGYWVEEGTSAPLLRIEPYSYFRSTDKSHTAQNLQSLKERPRTDELYARIKVGSDKSREFDQDTPNTQFGNVAFVGHFEEEYNIAGECVVETELDISTKVLVVDSNSIENAATNDDYDDEIFLIDTNGTTQTTRTNIGGIGWVYNDSISNKNAVLNWAGSIPGSIAEYLGTGDDEFEARTSADSSAGPTLTVNPVVYDNEISDPNANYDAVTNYEYTIPADGLFSFLTTTELSILWSGVPPLVDVYLDVTIIVNGSDLETQTNTHEAADGANPTFLNWFTVYGQSGDTVKIKIEAGPVTGGLIQSITLETGSSFECTATLTGGGVYATFDAEDAKVVALNFEAPLSLSEWQTIQSDRTKAIEIQTNWGLNAHVYKGNIEELTFKPFGVSTFELTKV